LAIEHPNAYGSQEAAN